MAWQSTQNQGQGNVGHQWSEPDNATSLKGHQCCYQSIDQNLGNSTKRIGTLQIKMINSTDFKTVTKQADAGDEAF